MIWMIWIICILCWDFIPWSTAHNLQRKKNHSYFLSTYYVTLYFQAQWWRKYYTLCRSRQKNRPTNTCVLKFNARILISVLIFTCRAYRHFTVVNGAGFVFQLLFKYHLEHNCWNTFNRFSYIYLVKYSTFLVPTVIK